MMDRTLEAIKANGYIITRESHSFDPSVVKRAEIVILTVHRTEFETIVLLNKTQPYTEPACVKITNDNKSEWIGKLKTTIKNNEKVIVYAEDEPDNGLIGFVNCLRKEPGSDHVSCVFIMDKVSFMITANLFINGHGRRETGN